FAPLVKTLPPRSATTPACFPLTLSSWLFHVNHRKRFAVHQRDRYGLHGDIAFCAEELRPRQGCPHLEASKSGGPRRILAGLQDHAADSAPSPVWMDEKRANLRLRHHSKSQPVREFYRGVLLRSEPQVSSTIFSANAEARATGSARRPA